VRGHALRLTGRRRLEHLEHAVGDHVPADHVHRREHAGHERDHVPDEVGRGRRDEDRAGEHDAVDGVGGRHQRGVQRGRHLADHLEADQQAEHEDGEVGDELGTHESPPNAGWTTSPAWVSTTPAWIGSSRSIARAPSRIRWPRSARTLLEYAVDAASGMVAARSAAPITVTPSSVTIVSPGREPSTLPPSSLAAMSTTTDPARIPLSAASVTSSGGRRPGTRAVVITTSWRAMCRASSAC